MNFCDTTAVILCAGKGERSNLGFNKVFFMLDNGKTVLENTLDAFEDFENVILVCANDEVDCFKKYNLPIIVGGKTRGESVFNALKSVSTPLVLIHDCARPYVTKQIICDCVEKARQTGCAVACVKEINSLKQVVDGIAKSVDRSTFYQVQTPQVFDSEKLKIAYEKVGINCTDDSEVYEKAGFTVCIANGDYSNKKLTSPIDFSPLNFKIGNGFDVHRLVENRPLILGGVKIEHYLGLLGHSDADVLTHAIMDALLSGAGLKDIGQLFPDTDPKFKGADSCKLLEQVIEKIMPYKVVNVSAVIMAQKPKMAPHIPLMRARLASILKVDVDCVNISATTTEKLGICGQEQGIASSATVLLSKV